MKIRPIVSVTVLPRNGEDGERLQAALSEIAGQDPTARIDIDSKDAHLVVAGMSESHLDSICERIQDEYAIPIAIGEPKVLYLETIRKASEAEGKYIRQTGGMGNYGHCKLRIEPGKPGKSYEFINDIKGGAVPSEYIEPIEQGVRDALKLGILAGYPIVGVKVTLRGGSYHETDSNQTAFKFAGSIALKEAARKASPVLLEPMMAVEEMLVAHESVRCVVDEINSRRGRVECKEQAAGMQLIHAVVPLAEALSSSPHGPLTYPMHFIGYDAVSGRDGPGDDTSGVTANNPRIPHLWYGSAAAYPDPDFYRSGVRSALLWLIRRPFGNSPVAETPEPFPKNEPKAPPLQCARFRFPLPCLSYAGCGRWSSSSSMP